MAKRIIWTFSAAKSKRNILRFWKENNKSNTYSIKLNKLLNDQIELLSTYPEMGIISDIKNIRIFIIRDYNIYYKIEGDSIVIVAIRDARQNPSDFKI